MGDIGQVSANLEDYVEVIYELVRENGIARVKDVAERKDVKMASVNSAIKKLADEKLIDHQTYGAISLTSKGADLAKDLEKRHLVIKRFLEGINVSPSVADADACAIEHFLHKETIKALTDHLIKEEEKGCLTAPVVTLRDIRPGNECRIKKMGLKGELKQRLIELGLRVGELVKVIRTAPLGDPISVKFKNCQLSIRKSDAVSIEVEELVS